MSAMLASSLVSFLKVAELGSVSRAAQALHLTQPAVSKQLRTLEQALGTALVARSGRGVRLTREGELVAEYGRRSAAVLEECSDALAELDAADAGKLVLGAGATTCIFQLPAWLGELRRERPRVDVTVRTGTSRVVEALVMACEVDLGLVTSPVTQRALKQRVLFREDIALVVAGDFRKPPASLESLPLILFPQSTGFRAYLDRKLGAERLGRLTKMESDSVEAIKSFVASGLGASFLPLSAVAHELSARSLRRLSLRGLPALRRSTSVVYRRDRTPGRAAACFLAILEAAAER
jgi:DNA-binding transcriptional LysR family regulator